MKTALITGASRGIGAACARALAEDGLRVIINYNNSPAPAQALAAELGGMAVKADISDLDAVKRMFDAVGDVDALVCNAGISNGQKLFQDTPPEEWRRLFAVNVDGVYNACRLALPAMIRRKSGCVITLASVWGQTGGSCETAYSATKGAVIAFTKALAKEVGPSGIRVNCVSPGVVETDMLSNLSAEALSACAEETPLCRNAGAREIAEAVRWLASEKAGFITGQVLGVNGGFYI